MPPKQIGLIRASVHAGEGVGFAATEIGGAGTAVLDGGAILAARAAAAAGAAAGVGELAVDVDEALYGMTKEFLSRDPRVPGLYPSQDQVKWSIVRDKMNKLLRGERLPPTELRQLPGGGFSIADGHHGFVAREVLGLPGDVRFIEWLPGAPEPRFYIWRQVELVDEFTSGTGTWSMGPSPQ